MYGVVLWSGQNGDRSLIWCEDHGDLAVCKDRSNEGSALRSGDVVTFDMSKCGPVRIARNVNLIAAEEYPALAGSLLAKNAAPKPAKEPPEARIIAFRSRHGDRPRHAMSDTAARRTGPCGQ